MKKLLSNNKLWNSRRLLLCLLLVGLVILPFAGLSNYMVRVLVNCLLYSALALSLNMFSGICGQISLGHIGFYCIGAYTSALMSLRLDAPFLLCFLCAGILTGFVAFLIGIPALRLSGGYLAVITISFSEIIRLVVLNWVSFTRGPMGLPGIPAITIFGYKFTSNKPYYFFMLIFCIVLVIIMRNLINSSFGRDLKAIRDDEIASEAMGINNYWNKVIVFAFSAAVAGLAGSVYAHCMRFIDPTSFKSDASMLILSMVVLGGMGNLTGSVIAAVVLTILPELLRGFESIRMLFYGFALIIMMLLRTVKPETYNRYLDAMKKAFSFKRNSEV